MKRVVQPLPEPAHAAGRHRPLGTRVVKVGVGLGRQLARVAAANVEPQRLRGREAGGHAADELERHGYVGGAGFVMHVHELGNEADVVVGRDVVAGLVDAEKEKKR